MKQPLFIQNIPIDEARISFIEKVVSRLARRAKKRTSAIITPYPISGCLAGDPVDGEVLRYIFCASGMVSRAIISLNKLSETGVAVSVAISNEAGGEMKSFMVRKKSTIIEPNIPISMGDKMIVSAKVIEPEKNKVNEIWVGFLWVPKVRDSYVKSFLIDSLERGADDLLETE